MMLAELLVKVVLSPRGTNLEPLRVLGLLRFSLDVKRYCATSLTRQRTTYTMIQWQLYWLSSTTFHIYLNKLLLDGFMLFWHTLTIFISTGSSLLAYAGFFILLFPLILSSFWVSSLPWLLKPSSSPCSLQSLPWASDIHVSWIFFTPYSSSSGSFYQTLMTSGPYLHLCYKPRSFCWVTPELSII